MTAKRHGWRVTCHNGDGDSTREMTWQRTEPGTYEVTCEVGQLPLIVEGSATKAYRAALGQVEGYVETLLREGYSFSVADIED